MERLLFLTLTLSSLLFAEVQNRYADQSMVDSPLQIVDIRTPGEWKNTGLLKGSIPIMFFDEHGTYNVKHFMKELNSKVDTKKQFALICNSGNRSRTLAAFLSKNYDYRVINLQGGIRYAIKKKLPIEPYKGK